MCFMAASLAEQLHWTKEPKVISDAPCGFISFFFNSMETYFQIFAVILLKKSGKPVGGCWKYCNSWDVYIIKMMRSFWHPWRWEHHGFFSQLLSAGWYISWLWDGQVTALAVHGNYMVRDALEVVVAEVRSSDDHRILLRRPWFSGLEWWKCYQGAWRNSNWNILRCKLAGKTIQTMSGWNLQKQMYVYIYLYTYILPKPWFIVGK